MRTQNIWTCTGGEDSYPHIRIDRPHKQTIVSLLPLAHQTYGGSFKSWFQNMVDIKTRQLGEHVENHCWHWRSENFYCHGPSTTASYISDIPVVLSVESIQDVDADQGMGNTDTPWDFPRSLYPLTRKLGQDHGLIYEMTARIFTSGHGRHFICRSVIPINGRAVVFDYDGMKHDGYSQRQTAKLDTLLAGHSPPCPSGYYTHAVIYHLKRGVKAQKVFHDHQVSEARKYFDIVPGNTSDDISRLSKSGFVELPDVAVAMWKDRPGREYELVEDDLENDLKKVDEKLSMPPIQTLDAISAPESTDMEIDHLGLEYNAVLTSEPETVKGKDSPLMLHDDSIISSSPPPSTPIQMLCRCGVERVIGKA
ncbi:hypothetical protein K435DRAFT_878357 [Dendrothele bispora CBS 962.96]|uniref:Uncharacterized protein n=1 Tax=Dendrothele bispora (strain CBS 962.96) TaxID=1314807 RepID=A0A4S8KN21_DENBC|nr:hypothetical protein K435DRAFT_878357 [Dendrothele bispora CBS 962.96]